MLDHTTIASITAVTIVLSLIGIGLSGFAVYCLVKVIKHLPANLRILTASLFTADILMFVSQPFLGYVQLAWDTTEKQTLCRAAVTLVGGAATLQFQHHALISLDSYLAISRPLRYISLVTPKRLAVSIAVSWTTSIAVGAALTIGPPIGPASVCTGLVSWIPATVGLGTYTVSGVGIILFYALTFRIAWRHQREMNHIRAVPASLRPCTSNPEQSGSGTLDQVEEILPVIYEADTTGSSVSVGDHCPVPNNADTASSKSVSLGDHDQSPAPNDADTASRSVSLGDNDHCPAANNADTASSKSVSLGDQDHCPTPNNADTASSKSVSLGDQDHCPTPNNADTASSKSVSLADQDHCPTPNNADTASRSVSLGDNDHRPAANNADTASSKSVSLGDQDHCPTPNNADTASSKSVSLGDQDHCPTPNNADTASRSVSLGDNDHCPAANNADTASSKSVSLGDQDHCPTPNNADTASSKSVSLGDQDHCLTPNNADTASSKSVSLGDQDHCPTPNNADTASRSVSLGDNDHRPAANNADTASSKSVSLGDQDHCPAANNADTASSKSVSLGDHDNCPTPNNADTAIRSASLGDHDNSPTPNNAVKRVERELCLDQWDIACGPLQEAEVGAAEGKMHARVVARGGKLLVKLGLFAHKRGKDDAAVMVMAWGAVTQFQHHALISVDRYLAISRPLRYVNLVKPRRLAVAVAICWTFSLALAASFTAEIARAGGRLLWTHAPGGEKTTESSQSTTTSITAVTAVLALTGVCLSGFAVFCLVKVIKHLPANLRILTASLFTADIVVFVDQPILCYLQLTEDMEEGMISCRAAVMVMAWGAVTQFQHHALISVDRYLAISRPLRYVNLVKPRRLAVAVAICWTFSLALAASFTAGEIIGPVEVCSGHASKIPVGVSLVVYTVSGLVAIVSYVKVFAQLGDKVPAQLGHKVPAQLGDKVPAAQLGDKVPAAQLGDKVPAQLGDKVPAQLGGKVPAQLGDKADEEDTAFADTLRSTKVSGIILVYYVLSWVPNFVITLGITRFGLPPDTTRLLLALCPLLMGTAGLGHPLLYFGIQRRVRRVDKDL
nr:hypothetical protein BaRGS_001671 [Batillaria attramentaria]